MFFGILVIIYIFVMEIERKRQERYSKQTNNNSKTITKRTINLLNYQFLITN